MINLNSDCVHSLAGRHYRTKLGGNIATLRLNVRNLGDTKHFSGARPGDGYLTFGEPRMVLLSAELAL